MIVLSLILACTTAELIVPNGEAPPNTQVWGPNSWQGSSPSSVELGDTAVEDSGITEEQVEGLEVGNIAPNLISTTALGLHWALYEQSHDLLLLAGNADSIALNRMLEEADKLDVDIIVLLGRNIYSMPATAEDGDSIQAQHPVSTVLLDPTLELVNEWAERAPPKAYYIDGSSKIQWSGFQSLDNAQLLELLSSP